MDFNNIAAILHDGVSPDEIAEAFTNALNTEIETYNEEMNAPETNFEILLDDLDSEGYDDEYFEDWTFADYTDLLSYVWNHTVMAYNAENDCDLEDLYLSDAQAHNLVDGFLGLYNSPLVQKMNEAATKCAKHAYNAGDKLCGCVVGGSIDEFENTLKEFLKNL